MNLLELITGTIAIFSCGVFVGAMSYAVSQRMIINRCDIIVGPQAADMNKLIRKLRVYANPSRMTLKRKEKKIGNVVKLEAMK